ncbi:hypothetical protein MKZ38_003374 [Zalerion maritima]|uniref:Uncharacterized protein n=1 Tax=Zalerion maritima TaxID=339359 RepID=A0AAD5RMR7_9PEZI|nr:hypothetical protein MKZ38_003374 [Zalerion maritima]
MNTIKIVTTERPLHEMRQKGHFQDQFFSFQDMTSSERPTSVATEFIDVDLEEDEDEEIVSEIEEDDDCENSPRTSLNSSGQRSLTTLSSYDEIQTPRSSRTRAVYPFDIDSFKQVEGPRGPHLFRSSTSSSNSAEFENALSLSPITPKASAPDNYASSLEEADLMPTPRQRVEPTCFTREPLDKDELARWPPVMVAQWMLNAGVEACMAEKFIDNDISGAIVYTLKFEDLKELGIQSFGVRSKVWEEIHVLRDSGPSSPLPTTPIEDTPSKEVKKEKKNVDEDKCTSKPKRSQSSRKKLRPAHEDIISPLESVSIVGIEQMMPKPHHCSKGENCSKWRRNQRLIESFKKDHPFVDMEKGGVIMVAGDPGNPNTADKIKPSNLKPTTDDIRPMSDAVPSVVASSDVLGPGTCPSVQNLEEAALAGVLPRDPQDNVRQFLDFQHAQGGPILNSEVPPTPPFEIFPAQQQKPHQQLRSLPKLAIPSGNNSHRQSAASIARAASAAPSQQQPQPQPQPQQQQQQHTQQQNRPSFVPYRMSIGDALSPDLQRGQTPYRFGTPFSDMDVPVTAVPLGPVARDASQSVPPDMNYRPQKLARSMSRASKRPSVSVMPALDENKPASPVVSRSPPPRPATSSPNRGLPASPKAWKDQGLPATCVPPKPAKEIKKPAPLQAPPRGGFSFSKTGSAQSPPSSSPPTVTKFDGVSHAGPMRKRRTKMLRHEWHEHYFTLKGTRLNMHEDANKIERTLEYIDVDDYAIACSSMVSTNKLKSAFRSANIGIGKDHKKDIGGFSFQLIPQDGKGGAKFLKKRESHLPARPSGDSAQTLVPQEGANGTGKTHHFAVKGRDERIDWMRELMLAKALKQKGEGFEISRNGNMI